MMKKLTEVGRLARNKYYREYYKTRKEKTKQNQIAAWNRRGEKELAAEEK